MSQSHTHLLVMISCKGSITAKKIANDLVAQNLCSSVHIVPGVHTYFRWVGKVENAEEQLILIKTVAEHYDNIEKSITRLHPHELPEIISVPIQSNQG